MEYGLIGEKLGHSFSKEIHGLIADYDYQLKELPREELDGFLKEKAFKGINVTIPYKRDVIPYLDEISPEARAIGAVNCIRNDNGRLIGHNTDYDGLKALILHTGVQVEGKKVLIAGTGGTSDTARAVCMNLGAAEIMQASRSGKNEALPYEEAEKVYSNVQVIINTTPCGMYPNIHQHMIRLDAYEKLEGVIDVVYNPLRTQLVYQALQRNKKAAGGLYMLVAQAVRASEFFRSIPADDRRIDIIFDKLREDKENIVLTGMPGSGKSTIGKELAQKTKKEFLDTDALIEEKAGKSISEIFAQHGEAYFRDLETEVILEVSKKAGAVIATGGGVVLRQENVDALKLNGRVFYIDRPVHMLIPTDDRPLAGTKEAIRQRYRERSSIYKNTADVVIKNPHTSEKAVCKIMETLK